MPVAIANAISPVALNRSGTTSAGGAAENVALETTWKTDNVGTSNDDQITIPLNSGATYNFNVDWGDGTDDDITIWNQAELTHTYSVAGTYTVSITGVFPMIYFNNGGDRRKILTIENWGEPTWTSMGAAFYGCSNLVINAEDLPDTGAVTDFSSAWQSCSSLTSFPLLDVSAGTNFQSAWRSCFSLTSFPLLDVSAGTNFQSAWRSCFSLATLAAGLGSNCGTATNMANCFFSATLATEDYSDFLVELEAANQNNSVSFHGGNSTYNAAGGTARTALVNDHSWTITDGGAA